MPQIPALRVEGDEQRHQEVLGGEGKGGAVMGTARCALVLVGEAHEAAFGFGVGMAVRAQRCFGALRAAPRGAEDGSVQEG